MHAFGEYRVMQRGNVPAVHTMQCDQRMLGTGHDELQRYARSGMHRRWIGIDGQRSGKDVVFNGRDSFTDSFKNVAFIAYGEQATIGRETQRPHRAHFAVEQRFGRP